MRGPNGGLRLGRRTSPEAQADARGGGRAVRRSAKAKARERSSEGQGVHEKEAQGKTKLRIRIFDPGAPARAEDLVTRATPIGEEGPSGRPAKANVKGRPRGVGEES